MNGPGIEIGDNAIFYGLKAQSSHADSDGDSEIEVGSPYNVRGNVLSKTPITEKLSLQAFHIREHGRLTMIGRESINLVKQGNGRYSFDCVMDTPKYPGKCIVQVRVRRNEIVDEATFEIRESAKGAD